jgi:AraC-like DNA-binding protein
LQNLECELARLRLELHQRIPVLPDAAGPAPGSPARQHLQAILDYLHQHYDRPLSLKELAATFKLNPDYLAHLFAQTMGLRFHDYLQELRLAKARELLLDPR